MKNQVFVRIQKTLIPFYASFLTSSLPLFPSFNYLKNWTLCILQIFAEEFPQVNVLNYSPGPVDTEMFDNIVTNAKDDEIRTNFGEMRDKKKILTTEATVRRLVEVLVNQKYKSGDHVDFYDEL